jgi:hypothetical protein
MNDDRIPIQFPRNLEEMLDRWTSSEAENIGWCLLCDSPIRTESDLIPGTDTHNCARGQELESIDEDSE